MGLGALLMILGLGTFALIGFDPSRLSALMPSISGVLFLALGYSAARRPGHQRQAGYGLVGLALLSIVLLVRGAWPLFSGRGVTVAVEHSVAAVLCALFLARILVWFVGQPQVEEG